MYCKNCGKQLSEGAQFCSACGTKVKGQADAEHAPAAPPSAETEPLFRVRFLWKDDEPEADAEHPADAQTAETVGGEQTATEGKAVHPRITKPPDAWNPVGFSDIFISRPILWYIIEKRGRDDRVLRNLIAVPVILFPLIALIRVFAGDANLFDLILSFNSGLALAAILWAVYAVRRYYRHVKGSANWEGTIIDKQPDGSASGGVLTAQTEDGKKKEFRGTETYDLYSYFQVGDRVKYHALLDYYEKYDKTNDSCIYCACCHTSNPVKNRICDTCGKPLFK